MQSEVWYLILLCQWIFQWKNKQNLRNGWLIIEYNNDYKKIFYPLLCNVWYQPSKKLGLSSVFQFQLEPSSLSSKLKLGKSKVAAIIWSLSMDGRTRTVSTFFLSSLLSSSCAPLWTKIINVKSEFSFRRFGKKSIYISSISCLFIKRGERLDRYNRKF